MKKYMLKIEWNTVGFTIHNTMLRIVGHEA